MWLAHAGLCCSFKEVFPHHCWPTFKPVMLMCVAGSRTRLIYKERKVPMANLPITLHGVAPLLDPYTTFMESVSGNLSRNMDIRSLLKVILQGSGTDLPCTKDEVAVLLLLLPSYNSLHVFCYLLQALDIVLTDKANLVTKSIYSLQTETLTRVQLISEPKRTWSAFGLLPKQKSVCPAEVMALIRACAYLYDLSVCQAQKEGEWEHEWTSISRKYKLSTDISSKIFAKCPCFHCRLLLTCCSVAQPAVSSFFYFMLKAQRRWQDQPHSTIIQKVIM